jgi:hypothetical protein
VGPDGFWAQGYKPVTVQLRLDTGRQEQRAMGEASAPGTKELLGTVARGRWTGPWAADRFASQSMEWNGSRSALHSDRPRP